LLILLFGPTGTGKTELIRLLTSRTSIRPVIPDMTRPLRVGESDKTSISDGLFARRQAEGYYILVNTMFGGNRYGTPRAVVVAALAAPEPSHIVDFPLEELGKAQSLNGFKRGVVVMPPSEEELVNRLHASKRVERVPAAVQQYADHLRAMDEGLPDLVEGIVVNADLEEAYSRLCTLIWPSSGKGV